MNKVQQDFKKWAEQDWWGWSIDAVFDDSPCHNLTIAAQWEAYQEAYNLQQATIDRLMLEFCPDEMSPEQLASWENAQKRVEE